MTNKLMVKAMHLVDAGPDGWLVVDRRGDLYPTCMGLYTSDQYAIAPDSARVRHLIACGDLVLLGEIYGK